MEKRTTYTQYQKLLQHLHKNNLNEIEQLLNIIIKTSSIQGLEGINEEVAKKLVNYGFLRAEYCLSTIKKIAQEYQEETFRANKEFEEPDSSKEFKKQKMQEFHEWFEKTKEKASNGLCNAVVIQNEIDDKRDKHKFHFSVDKQDTVNLVDKYSLTINGRKFDTKDGLVDVLSDRGIELLPLTIAIDLLHLDPITYDLILYGNWALHTEKFEEAKYTKFNARKQDLFFINQYTLAISEEHSTRNFVIDILKIEGYKKYKDLIRNLIKDKINLGDEFKLIGEFK